MKLRTIRISLALCATLLSLPLASHAADLGFRYYGNACVDKNGKAGFNPSYFGQCGDLRYVTINELNFDGTDFSGAQFGGANLQHSSFNGANFTGASFNAADLSGAVLTSAVIHQADFTQAILLNVHLGGADIQSSNFTGANLAGMVFSTMSLKSSTFKGASLAGAAMDSTDLSSCDFTGADLSKSNLQSAKLNGAKLDQADFSGADLTSADLTSVSGTATKFNGSILRQANLQGAQLPSAHLGGAQMDHATLTKANLANADLHRTVMTGTTLTNVMLTGAVFSKSTMLPITVAAAEALGMEFDASARLLLIYDANDPNVGALLSGMEKLGVDATVSTTDETGFDGSMDLSPYLAVLHLNGTNSGSMPSTGQTALVTFVQTGGVYINTGMLSSVQAGTYTQMTDLLLLNYQSGGQSTITLTPVASVSSPILNGITASLSVTSSYTVAVVNQFASNPSVVLMTDSNTDPLVVQRDLGTGHAIQLGLCTYGYNDCLATDAFQELVANATKWITPAR